MNRFLLGAACCLVILAGCGGPTKYPLSGVVELDGEPIQEGDLTFLPKDKGQVPEGARVRDGRYAVLIGPGCYSVKVSAPKKVPTAPGEKTAYGGTEKVINIIPPSYGEKTTLVANVTGPAEVDFKLTTKKK